ncbi:hypothetical protein H8356DRAFT_1282696 [Neocallimastix lanati (nom. inval.)]|nr:hypothetical protein H8356DRAFT_1282696 [Neocallimastix sp. JGI-2020a]
MIIYKALNKCIVYKALNKCKSFIVLNVKKEILKYENEIRKSTIPLGIKSKHIFNEVSPDMGFICPLYIDVTNNNVHFLKFIEYFKNNYLKNYKNWNYYNNIVHITNKVSESFNNYLNYIFSKNLHFIN